MIKVKFSDSYRAKKRRIENIPQFFIDFAKTWVKRDAINMVKNFREGIEKNNFRLDKLKETTIVNKERQGYSAPLRPLFGLGPNGDKTYMNMLRIRELKYGYKVYPSRAKHHKADLKLKDLLQIHEFGTAFSKKNGTVVRIPPRPAFRKAYERTLRQKAEIEVPEVKKELSRYIREGKKDFFEKVKTKSESDEKKIKEAFQAD